MEYEEAATQIAEAIRRRLQQVAASTGSEFVDESNEPKAKGAPGFCFRLIPANPKAATLEVMPDGAASVYIGVGASGWIEVFASPKKPSESVEDAMQVIDAIVAGRIKERVWRRKRTGDLVDSLLHIQRLDGHWRLIGEVGRPLPGIRKLLYSETLIEYAPYNS